MQKLIIEKVFYSLSKIPNFNCDQIDDQLLLYIYGEGRVGKSRIVHAMEIEYGLLLQDLDLVITIPTRVIANNIGGSTIHTSLAIGIKNRHENSNAISNLWTA